MDRAPIVEDKAKDISEEREDKEEEVKVTFHVCYCL